MRTLFLIALFFAFLLDPAVASNPILDSALPTAPMSILYDDPDGMLDLCCGLCQIYACSCSKLDPSFAPNITPAMILGHEEWKWPSDHLYNFDVSPDAPVEQQQPAPGEAYYNRQSLQDHHLLQFNQNATIVMPSTVQAHVYDTYTVGDRLESRSSTGPRHQQPRRQPPRPGGGFPCEVEDCGKAYNRHCDLRRHMKTHLDDSQRSHKCPVCSKGFLYPKDVARHEKTHDESLSSQTQLYCHIPGCTSSDGFSRRDNLLRHQRKKHGYTIG